MAGAMAVQVTMYLTEGDSWHHRPLHVEILKYLREENVAGAAAFHSVAGFHGRSRVRTAERRISLRQAATCPLLSLLSIVTNTSIGFFPSSAKWPLIV
jgi:hypothetical protein